MSSLPAWGFVTAAPHQFLILLRGGQVHRSQQGGGLWRWPTDTVAIVDTSVHRLQFSADQVTREKAGVQVTGLAVFRIVDPLIAWKMLNLDQPDALANILREMFVGATRRLVANLSLEDCLTRRKDALATELMAEVAPVVQGRGHPGDGTDRGWGVAIDTIEVQDVRVLSKEVFDRLQAPFRAKLALEATAAQAEVDRADARLAAEVERAEESRRRDLAALEQARIEEERQREQVALNHRAELRRLEHEAELARVLRSQEEKAATARRDAELERELASQKLENQLTAERQRVEAERERLRMAAEGERERSRLQAEGELERSRLQAEADVARSRMLAEGRLERAKMQAEATRLLGVAHVEVLRLERAATNEVSEGRLRELTLTQTMPAVASALRGSFGEIQVRPSDLGELLSLGEALLRRVEKQGTA